MELKIKWMKNIHIFMSGFQLFPLQAARKTVAYVPAVQKLDYNALITYMTSVLRIPQALGRMLSCC